MSELTGQDLDKAIAVLLGYKVVDSPELEWDDSQRDWVSLYYVSDDGTPREVAWYHADANATLAVCAERGWYLSFTGNTALIARDIGGGFAHTHRGDGATPQEAAARALFAALSAVTP